MNNQIRMGSALSQSRAGQSAHRTVLIEPPLSQFSHTMSTLTPELIEKLAEDFINRVLAQNISQKIAENSPDLGKIATQSMDLIIELRGFDVQNLREAVAKVLAQVNSSPRLVGSSFCGVIGSELKSALELAESESTSPVQITSQLRNYVRVGNPGHGDCGLYAVMGALGVSISNIQQVRQDYLVCLEKVSRLSQYLQHPQLQFSNQDDVVAIQANLTLRVNSLMLQQQSLAAAQLSSESIELVAQIRQLITLVDLIDAQIATPTSSEAQAELLAKVVALGLHLEPSKLQHCLLALHGSFSAVRFFLIHCVNEQVQHHAQKGTLRPPELSRLLSLLRQCVDGAGLEQILSDLTNLQTLVNVISPLTLPLAELAEYRRTSVGSQGWLHSADIRALFLSLGYVFEQVCSAAEFVGESREFAGSAVVFINQAGRRAIVRNSARFVRLNVGSDYGDHWEAIVEKHSKSSVAKQDFLREQPEAVSLAPEMWTELDNALKFLNFKSLAYQHHEWYSANHAQTLSEAPTRLAEDNLAMGALLALSSLKLGRVDKLFYVINNLFFDQRVHEIVRGVLEPLSKRRVPSAEVAVMLTQFLVAWQQNSLDLTPAHSQLRDGLKKLNPHLLPLLQQLATHRYPLLGMTKLTHSYSKLIVVGYIASCYCENLLYTIQAATRGGVSAYSLDYAEFNEWLTRTLLANQELPQISPDAISSVRANAKINFDLGGDYAKHELLAPSFLVNFPAPERMLMPNADNPIVPELEYRQALKTIKRVLTAQRLPIWSNWDDAEAQIMQLSRGYQQRFELFLQEINISLNASSHERLAQLNRSSLGSQCLEVYNEFSHWLKLLHQMEAQLSFMKRQINRLNSGFNAALFKVYQTAYSDVASKKMLQLSEYYGMVKLEMVQLQALTPKLCSVTTSQELISLSSEVTTFVENHQRQLNEQPEPRLTLTTLTTDRSLPGIFLRYFSQYHEFSVILRNYQAQPELLAGLTTISQQLSALSLCATEFYAVDGNALDSNPMHQEKLAKIMSHTSDIVELAIRDNFYLIGVSGAKAKELLPELENLLNQFISAGAPLGYLLPLADYLLRLAANSQRLQTLASRQKLPWKLIQEIEVLQLLLPQDAVRSGGVLDIITSEYLNLQEVIPLVAKIATRFQPNQVRLETILSNQRPMSKLYEFRNLLVDLAPVLKLESLLVRLTTTLESLRALGTVDFDGFVRLELAIKQSRGILHTLTPFVNEVALLGLSMTTYQALLKNFLEQNALLQKGEQVLTELTEALRDFLAALNQSLNELADYCVFKWYQSKVGVIIDRSKSSLIYKQQELALRDYIHTHYPHVWSLLPGQIELTYVHSLADIKRFDHALRSNLSYHHPLLERFDRQVVNRVTPNLHRVVAQRNLAYYLAPVVQQGYDLQLLFELEKELLRPRKRHQILSTAKVGFFPAGNMEDFATRFNYNIIAGAIYSYLLQLEVLNDLDSANSLSRLFTLAASFEEIYLLHHYYPAELAFDRNTLASLAVFENWFLMSYKILYYILQQGLKIEERLVASQPKVGQSIPSSQQLMTSVMLQYQNKIGHDQIEQLLVRLTKIEELLLMLHSTTRERSHTNEQICNHILQHSAKLEQTLATLDQVFLPLLSLLSMRTPESEQDGKEVALFICHQYIMDDLLRQLALLLHAPRKATYVAKRSRNK